jgi:hypothetical protein
MTARTTRGPRAGKEAADYHDLQLHRAKQRGEDVVFRGQPHQIQALYVHQAEPEMVVYLIDISVPVRPHEVTIQNTNVRQEKN